MSFALPCLVAAAGAAALSWEVVWQLQASLSLGVSALGASLTLIATMGGMGVGSWGMGRLLRRPALARVHPLRTYAALEGVVGLSGLLVIPGFQALEALDRVAFGWAPGLGSTAHLVGILVLLAPATIAMGATAPLLGDLARQIDRPLSRLYAWNLGGASAGCLLMAFVALPELGVTLATRLLVVADLCVAGVAWVVGARPAAPASAHGAAPTPDPAPWGWARTLVFVTGLSTFALEVSWFRSLRATLQSTTETFALILVAVLIPLGVGARAAPRLRRAGLALGGVLAAAGVAIVMTAPVLERFDLLAPRIGHYWLSNACNLALSMAILGPPTAVLGCALPWVRGVVVGCVG